MPSGIDTREQPPDWADPNPMLRPGPTLDHAGHSRSQGDIAIWRLITRYIEIHLRAADPSSRLARIEGYRSYPVLLNASDEGCSVQDAVARISATLLPVSTMTW